LEQIALQLLNDGLRVLSKSAIINLDMPARVRIVSIVSRDLGLFRKSNMIWPRNVVFPQFFTQPI